MKVTETSIRPDKLHDEFNELLAEEIRDFFLDKETLQLKKGVAKWVNCPACDNHDFKPYVEKDGFKLQACNSCGLVFVNPRPDERSLISFFSQSKAMNLYSEMVEETKSERYDLIFRPLAEFINNNYGKRGGHLLEVGCGSGLFLEVMAKENANWILKGVEPSERAVEICKSKDIDVFHGSLEELNENNKYDLIVFWAVFDHFFDPLMIVKKVYKLLKSGGTLLIGNMNIDGFDSTILGPDNFAFTPPERQNFFGEKSMKVMLERAGFKDIEIKTTGKLDVDIVRNYWMSGGKNGRNKFLEKIVLGDADVRNAFQSFLTDNNLSGHMTITAVKDR